MTDLEMTKLCAEAMGWNTKVINYGMKGNTVFYQRDVNPKPDWCEWYPLENDAQAMALVKHLSIQVHFHGYAGHRASLVTVQGRMKLDDYPTKVTATDLNRAIVECVAKMQAGK